MNMNKIMIDSGARAAEEALRAGDLTRADVMLSDLQYALDHSSPDTVDHRISACVGLANTLSTAAHALIQSGTIQTRQRVPSAVDLVHDAQTDYGRFIAGLSTIIALHKDVFARGAKIEYTFSESNTRPILVPGARFVKA